MRGLALNIVLKALSELEAQVAAVFDMSLKVLL
jgi:hypothetical protein